MKTRSGPFTMTSLIESSRMRCSIGFRNGRIISNPFIVGSPFRSSSLSIGDLLEIGFVGVVVVGLQVAKCLRHWIEAVVCDGNGLCILEFGEGLHVETKVGMWEVALRGRNVGFVGDGLAGEQAYTRIVPALRKVVANFELVFPTAQLACGASREVV